MLMLMEVGNPKYEEINASFLTQFSEIWFVRSLISHRQLPVTLINDFVVSMCIVVKMKLQWLSARQKWVREIRISSYFLNSKLFTRVWLNDVRLLTKAFNVSHWSAILKGCFFLHSKMSLFVTFVFFHRFETVQFLLFWLTIICVVCTDVQH